MDILRHVTKVLGGTGNHPPLSLGRVSERNAELVRRHTGHDIDGYRRVFESSDIRHMIASHGNAAKEAARGQKPVAKHDFLRIPEIVETAYRITLVGEPGSRKPRRLIYRARIDADEYEYVEQLRAGNKVVALKTMAKR